MRARLQSRPAHDHRQVPLLLAVEREPKPKAALGARLTGVLHEHLTGLGPFAGRSPKYWQLILRGERPACLARDVAAVAQHPSKEAKLATLGLAAVLVDAARPAGEPGSIAEQVAAFSAESADVAPAFIRAMDDGELSTYEIAGLLREVLEAESRLLRLRAVLNSRLVAA